LPSAYKPPIPTWLERPLALFHVDWSPGDRQPRALAVVLATAVSIVGSLVVDAILVAIGTTTFPSTRGYVHFQFGDYAKLTVIGVVIACVAWPIVTRITSTPRWLFFRMAVAVTVVLLLPDVYLLVKGQPGKGVIVLMTMHLAIALVTYNALVHLSPSRGPRVAASGAPGREEQFTGGAVGTH
jgi:hypothetical protein